MITFLLVLALAIGLGVVTGKLDRYPHRPDPNPRPKYKMPVITHVPTLAELGISTDSRRTKALYTAADVHRMSPAEYKEARNAILRQVEFRARSPFQPYTGGASA